MATVTSADPASLGFSALEPADFICCKTPPHPRGSVSSPARPGPGVLVLLFCFSALLGRLWKLPKFFAPRRLSKSAREAISTVPERACAPSWLPCRFWNDFGLQNGPPGGPRNPQNQGFRVDCLQKLTFSHFQHRSPNGGPK